MPIGPGGTCGALPGRPECVCMPCMGWRMAPGVGVVERCPACACAYCAYCCMCMAPASGCAMFAPRVGDLLPGGVLGVRGVPGGVFITMAGDGGIEL